MSIFFIVGDETEVLYAIILGKFSPHAKAQRRKVCASLDLSLESTFFNSGTPADFREIVFCGFLRRRLGDGEKKIPVFELSGPTP